MLTMKRNVSAVCKTMGKFLLLQHGEKKYYPLNYYDNKGYVENLWMFKYQLIKESSCY
jgi:hypothetical protein